MDWTHCNFLLQDYVYSEEHILKIKSLLHNPLEAHIILEETLVEIKWTAKDECLKSSVDSMRVFISPSSSCSLATLDTFQASFWP